MNESTPSANGSSVSVELPLPDTAITTYQAATGTELANIERALAEIDLNDSNSILFFGTAAQGEVTTVADEMLEAAK